MSSRFARTALAAILAVSALAVPATTQAEVRSGTVDNPPGHRFGPAWAHPTQVSARYDTEAGAIALSATMAAPLTEDEVLLSFSTGKPNALSDGSVSCGSPSDVRATGTIGGSFFAFTDSGPAALWHLTFPDGSESANRRLPTKLVGDRTVRLEVTDPLLRGHDWRCVSVSLAEEVYGEMSLYFVPLQPLRLDGPAPAPKPSDPAPVAPLEVTPAPAPGGQPGTATVRSPQIRSTFLKVSGTRTTLRIGKGSLRTRATITVQSQTRQNVNGVRRFVTLATARTVTLGAGTASQSVAMTLTRQGRSLLKARGGRISARVKIVPRSGRPSARTVTLRR